MIWDIVFKDFEYFTDEVGRRGPIDVILTRPSRSGTYTMCASGEVDDQSSHPTLYKVLKVKKRLNSQGPYALVDFVIC